METSEALPETTFNATSAKVVWDLASAWTGDNGTTSSYQGKSGKVVGTIEGYDGNDYTVKMHVNAEKVNGTNGKFEAQQANSRTQMNANTVITVPVTDGAIVSVTKTGGTFGILGETRETYTHSGSATGVAIYCTANGYLTEVSVSKLDLTALSADLLGATATGEVQAVVLDKTEFELMRTLSATLTATTYASYGASAGTVSWSSDNTSVATVSSGTVTAAADSGTAKITATCNGKSASCTVTATAYTAVDLSSATVTWDLTPSSINIENNTGTVSGTVESSSKTVTMNVDATNNGKLQGDGSKHAQFNSGTKITIPVTSGCSIAVTVTSAGNQYALYTINGEAASTSASVTTVNYSGSAGTIDIVSTGSAYPAKIVVSGIDLTNSAISSYVSE